MEHVCLKRLADAEKKEIPDRETHTKPKSFLR